MSADAVVLDNVTKHFRKTSRKREHTTLKSELVRLVTGRSQRVEPGQRIEALRGVSFSVPKGQTIGIVGRNGSGKSTLLKLVTGIYTPTSGTITVNGRISALLELGAGFHPDFTGRENILINGIILGMTRAEVKRRIEAIIDFAELGDFIDERVRTYSSGMFMRLAFAVATHVDPDVLIIDEILAVGDEHFQKKSYAKLEEFKRSGRTIILVTHALDTVENWCDQAVWIDGGFARSMGPPREVAREYRAALAVAEEQTARTGQSALSMPGLALPATSRVPSMPAIGPDCGTTVTAVQLGSTSAPGAQGFSSAEPLSVVIHWSSTAAHAGQLGVEILDSAERPLFSTNSPVVEFCPGTGSVGLLLPRLSLGEGHYSIAVGLRSPDVPLALRKDFGVSVETRARGAGVLALEHEWLKPSFHLPAPHGQSARATESG
jgi:lipopolysaccharide transport system ATP-binding protein